MARLNATRTWIAYRQKHGKRYKGIIRLSSAGKQFKIIAAFSTHREAKEWLHGKP